MRFFFGLLLIALPTGAIAQSVVPTLWTPDAKKYEHVGKMEYRPRRLQDSLQNRDDVYHAGEYDCLPGDAHNAPDCRKRLDWLMPVQREEVIFTLEDGKKLSEYPDTCLFWNDEFCVIAQTWSSVLHGGRIVTPTDDVTHSVDADNRPVTTTIMQFGQPASGTFLYHVFFDKKHPGEYGLLVGYADRQSKHYREAIHQALESVVVSDRPQFK